MKDQFFLHCAGQFAGVHEQLGKSHELQRRSNETWSDNIVNEKSTIVG